MIEKNIRLQPHHARDLLVGRRSDGKRPGYQPPGGGATSLGSGRDVSGGGGGHDRGGGQHAAQAAAAQHAARQRAAAAAATQAAAQKAEIDRQNRVAEQAAAERQRVSMIAGPVQGLISQPTIETPIRHHGVDTPTQIKEQIVLDEIREEEKERFDADWEFEDKKAKAPTTFEPKTKTYEKHVPFTDDPVEIITQMQSPTYYQDKSKIGGETWGERAEAGIKRGSGILGTMGKIALTGLTAGAGAGVFGKDIANIAKAAKWVGRGKKIKTALDKGKIYGIDISNLKSTIDKAADRRSRPKGMPEHLGERGFRTRDETPTRDGDGANIQQAITGEKGVLTEGAETLGLTNEQREQYLLMQNKMKMALDQGSYTNQQGQVIQLNDQQIEQLQNYIDNLNNILGTVLQGAAHGGRIDGPLMGGSKYI
jgi:hypothetical protein